MQKKIIIKKAIGSWTYEASLIEQSGEDLFCLLMGSSLFLKFAPLLLASSPDSTPIAR